MGRSLRERARRLALQVKNICSIIGRSPCCDIVEDNTVVLSGQVFPDAVSFTTNGLGEGDARSFYPSRPQGLKTNEDQSANGVVIG